MLVALVMIVVVDEVGSWDVFGGSGGHVEQACEEQKRKEVRKHMMPDQEKEQMGWGKK